MRRVAGVRFIITTVAIALAFVGRAAHAQGSAVITGRVTNEQGAPLSNANVSIPTLAIGGFTTATGSYSFSVPAGRVTGQQVALTARAIGYVRQSRNVTLSAGSQSQNFALKGDPFRLDEVVVTGVANATSQTLIPFSVSRLSEAQLKEVPASSPVAALAGKIAGAKIAMGVGNPGGEPTIRLRGSTNIGIGTSSPLLIVDGVITKYSISDIDANDVESIEVLKGAAAASFYGSDAANGVVNITTKRGRDLQDDKLSFQVRSEYGQSGITHFVPLTHSHNYATNPDGTIRLVDGARYLVDSARRYMDVAYPSSGPTAFRNQLETWLQDGNFYSTNFQLGLRRGNTNFNSSFTNDHNQGVLPLTNGQFRQNVRINIDQGLTDKADLSASITYGINKNDYDPGSSDAFFALLQSPPDLDLANPDPVRSTIPYYAAIPTILSGNARGNPLYGLNNEEYALRRERLLGAFSARYRPFSWLKLEGSYGTDRLNSKTSDYRFKGFLNSSGAATDGYYSIGSGMNVAENSQLNATATKILPWSVLSTTRLAYLVETVDELRDSVRGSKLIVNAVPDLAALDQTVLATSSDQTIARTIDYQASQNFTIKDRYIIDGQVRRDQSSLFGPESRSATFYRVAGAYRISEDFSIPGVQELKIRAARGTAGLRPDFVDQYETFTLANSQITKYQLGNKALEPAIQTEDEFGINASFLNHFDLELVQANRITKGAFLRVPLSLAASGGFENQMRNAADISARTTELSLQTLVVDRPGFSYSFGITGDHTSQRIDRLGRAPYRINAGGQSQDVFYYKEGEPLGIVYGGKFVHSFADLQITCAKAPTTGGPTGGCLGSAAPVEANYVVNPLGFLVLKSQRGLFNEVPIKFIDATGADQFVIGDVNPDFSFGFSNNFKIGGVGIYALFDGQRGGQIYNFTKQWMFQDFRHGDFDQSGKPDDQKITQQFYAFGLYNGLGPNEYFVEDASYVKLRELSVSYNVAARFLDRVRLNRYVDNMKIAVIGRNLHTWTSYSGFDPEVTSGNDFNFRIDGFRYPQFRTITGQISIGF